MPKITISTPGDIPESSSGGAIFHVMIRDGNLVVFVPRESYEDISRGDFVRLDAEYFADINMTQDDIRDGKIRLPIERTLGTPDSLSSYKIIDKSACYGYLKRKKETRPVIDVPEDFSMSENSIIQLGFNEIFGIKLKGIFRVMSTGRNNSFLELSSGKKASVRNYASQLSMIGNMDTIRTRVTNSYEVNFIREIPGMHSVRMTEFTSHGKLPAGHHVVGWKVSDTGEAGYSLFKVEEKMDINKLAQVLANATGLDVTPCGESILIQKRRKIRVTVMDTSGEVVYGLTQYNALEGMGLRGVCSSVINMGGIPVTASIAQVWDKIGLSDAVIQWNKNAAYEKGQCLDVDGFSWVEIMISGGLAKRLGLESGAWSEVSCRLTLKYDDRPNDDKLYFVSSQIMSDLDGEAFACVQGPVVTSLGKVYSFNGNLDMKILNEAGEPAFIGEHTYTLDFLPFEPARKKPKMERL